MEDSWDRLYQADLARYRDDPLWSENGIRPYVDADGQLIEAHHPWTCGFCTKRKRFCCLQQSEDHFLQPQHCNQISWEYGDERPALPKWQRCREAGHARAPGIPPAPSPPVWPRETTSAAVLQGPPPSSSTQFESYSWLLRDSTINGVPVACAALTVNVTRETTTPPFASLDIWRASMSCQPLPARCWDTPGSPPFALPPRVDAEDTTDHPRASPAFKAPPPSSRPMAPSVPAPAGIRTPAPASPPRPTLRNSLPGMAGMVAKQPPAWTSPKAPPPMPPPPTASDVAPPGEMQVPPPRRWGAPANAS